MGKVRGKKRGRYAALFVFLKGIDPAFQLLFGFSGFLLEATEQLILFAFFVEEVVVGEIGILLLDLAF
jgi:hypothetical protein